VPFAVQTAGFIPYRSARVPCREPLACVQILVPFLSKKRLKLSLNGPDRDTDGAGANRPHESLDPGPASRFVLFGSSISIRPFRRPWGSSASTTDAPASVGVTAARWSNGGSCPLRSRLGRLCVQGFSLPFSTTQLNSAHQSEPRDSASIRSLVVQPPARSGLIGPVNAA
jgi:hypothetical protein